MAFGVLRGLTAGIWNATALVKRTCRPTLAFLITLSAADIDHGSPTYLRVGICDA